MNAPINILLVDDNELRRLLLAHHLLIEFPTANIRQCSSATEAIEQLRVSAFDAVVTDNSRLPVSGIDLIRWVRVNCAHAVIVMVSSSPWIEKTAREAGAHAVFSSFQFEKLGGVLALLLGEPKESAQ